MSEVFKGFIAKVSVFDFQDVDTYECTKKRSYSVGEILVPVDSIKHMVLIKDTEGIPTSINLVINSPIWRGYKLNKESGMWEPKFTDKVCIEFSKLEQIEIDNYIDQFNKYKKFLQ